MVNFPDINPVALALGPLKIYWYGIMYLVAFSSVWALAQYRAEKQNFILSKNQISDLIFYGALGVVIGGRVGYMLFYQLSAFLANPFLLFAIWRGGMSFHGGLIGVGVAFYVYARHVQQPFLRLTDFIIPFVPIGLAAGRIGNFINGELWGRPTDLPWGMVFPRADALPRHPSPLYEFALEGVVLFIIMWIYSKKPRPMGKVSGLFLIFYGIFRFIAEFFRQPDVGLGFVAFDWLTMGQLLSVPMVVVGLWLFLSASSTSSLVKPIRESGNR